MRTRRQARHAQQAVLFVSLVLFNLVLVTIQLWLFVGALEAMLDGRRGMALPAAGVSFAILAANAWMYFGIRRMERQN